MYHMYVKFRGQLWDLVFLLPCSRYRYRRYHLACWQVPLSSEPFHQALVSQNKQTKHLKEFLFVCMCVMCMCVYMLVRACLQRVQKRVPDALELELQAVTHCGCSEQLNSSARAASTPNH